MAYTNKSNIDNSVVAVEGYYKKKCICSVDTFQNYTGGVQYDNANINQYAKRDG
jgi:hypothetical protein